MRTSTSARVRESKPPFIPREALKRADDILSFAPARAHIVRIEGKGRLVRRFALPLDLCQPQNRTRHGQGWQLGKLKKECFDSLWMQNSHTIQRDPLPGRPMVRCIRFSSSEPDAFSDWAKIPVDRLCARHMGLGYIRDDKPSVAEIVQWHEPTTRGQGFCLFEIWTGEEIGL